jgi:hypothetical protein
VTLATGYQNANYFGYNQTAVRRLKAWKVFEQFMQQEMISVISPEVVVSFIAEKVIVNKASTGVIESYRTAVSHIIEVIG